MWRLLPVEKYAAKNPYLKCRPVPSPFPALGFQIFEFYLIPGIWFLRFFGVGQNAPPVGLSWPCRAINNFCDSAGNVQQTEMALEPNSLKYPHHGTFSYRPGLFNSVKISNRKLRPYNLFQPIPRRRNF